MPVLYRWGAVLSGGGGFLLEPNADMEDRKWLSATITMDTRALAILTEYAFRLNYFLLQGIHSYQGNTMHMFGKPQNVFHRRYCFKYAPLLFVVIPSSSLPP